MNTNSANRANAAEMFRGRLIESGCGELSFQSVPAIVGIGVSFSYQRVSHERASSCQAAARQIQLRRPVDRSTPGSLTLGISTGGWQSRSSLRQPVSKARPINQWGCASNSFFLERILDGVFGFALINV